MTEYELVDYAASTMSNFLSALTIYFSIVTAYVIAAFVAGSRLTRVQLAIVNLCFVVAAGVIGSLSVLIFARFYSIASQVAKPGDAVGPIDFTVPLGILEASVFIGCMVFMWSIRKGRIA